MTRRDCVETWDCVEWVRLVGPGEVEGKGRQAREGWRQFVSRHVLDAW